MKVVYPVVFKNEDDGIVVYVPAFDCGTQGDNYLNAIEMARDVIALMAIDYEDDGKKLPVADFNIEAKEGEKIALIDVDLLAYRKKYDNKAVRKNVTIPNWLNVEAERMNVNFSKVLTEALQSKLKIK